MSRLLTIALLLAGTFVLPGCNPPPDPTNPELLQGGPFPNLSDVPDRPKTMPLAEREKVRRELMQDNQKAHADE